MDFLQKLYDSEIGWRIHAEWDGGFCWTLQPYPFEGYEGFGDTLDEAVGQMVQAALVRFPESVFAQAYIADSVGG